MVCGIRLLLSFKCPVVLTAAVIAWLSSIPRVFSKTVQGQLALAAHQARVVTKFCFDFNRACGSEVCPGHDIPGKFTFHIYGGHGGQPTPLWNGMEWNTTDVYIALLDDEYFSFQAVAKVWDDLSCQEIRKAAKRSLPVNWVAASTSKGDFIATDLVQKIRPRWWYVAFVSCSDYGVDFSYKIQLHNLRHGWQREFSFDMIGVYSGSSALCVAFGGLALIHLDSLRSWLALSRTTRWLRLHPALLLLGASACLAFFGEVCWISYYSQFQQAGEGNELEAVVGRGCIVAAKVLISLLLILFSRGECICTPDIDWSENRELTRGLAIFGILCFMLELWGDSESRSTSVEYVYDTRAGTALVAFDVFWLWLYVSRSWKTFRAETRLKQRLFFKLYSFPLGLWFAALPAVATAASLIAPWVRWRITFIVNNCVHVAALALLIYTFRPAVAVTLYDVQAKEYASISREELAEM